MAPEPARLLTRDEVAHREVGRTRISRALALAMSGLFLATIAAVPLAQAIHDAAAYVRGDRASPLPQALDVLWSLPHAVAACRAARGDFLDRVLAANECLNEELRLYQGALRRQSFFAEVVVPPVNGLLTGRLGAGSEDVYVGRGGWLFYKADVDYVIGPPFLDPHRQAHRRGAGVVPDPRPAIMDLKRQLAARGIALVVMPVPVKPTIHPEALSAAYGADAPVLENASFAPWKADLEREGVLVFDVAELLRAARVSTGRPQFLRTDTHWSPGAAELAARALAEFLRQRVPLPAAPSPAYQAEAAEVTAQGDLAAMLRLPENAGRIGAETVTVHEVLTPALEPWRPSRAADVLVLGDSFSNIYSLELMGWGDSGGLVEHLALELGRPVDAVLRNAAGARATREMLGRQQARGRDRLAGKRVVIWQFAARELAFGDWRPVSLALGGAPALGFFVPAPGTAVTATGTVQAISAIPRQGRTPYRNHIMAVHLADVAVEGRNEPQEAVVYLWSMRNTMLTPAGRLRPGDSVTLRLRPWNDVAEMYGGMNRSELAEEGLYLQDHCWGEPVTP